MQSFLVVLLVETMMIFLSVFFDEYKVQKNRIYFKYSLNNVKVATVTFDQIKASLLNKIFD